jgi:hypothetical protein
MEDKPRLARRVSRMQLVGVVEDDAEISGRVTGGVSAQAQDRLEMEDFRYNHRDSLLMALDLQAPSKTRPSHCSHRRTVVVTVVNFPARTGRKWVHS